MKKENELVMGVPTNLLFESGFYFSGYARKSPLIDYLKNRVEKYASFRRRADCETDPEFKQVIPYCLLTAGDSIFVYRRKTGSDETRLHTMASLGVGGHINPMKEMNRGINPLIHASMMRELAEEVLVLNHQPPILIPTLVGMINDDQNDVGKVHLGLVYHIELDSAATVEVMEKDKLEGKMQPLLETAADITVSWEPWSKIVIDNYLLPMVEVCA